MPVKFDFATAGRIIFRAGAVQELRMILPGLGRQPALLTGAGGANQEIVRQMLAELDLGCTQISVEGEPTVAFIQSAVAQAREAGCDCVVAFGGGSVVDSGKALAALLVNGGDVLDYLEVVGKNQPLKKPGLPVVAVPTTAGTGSEVTRNAVLAVPEHRMKVSLRSAWMLPSVALVDPELTYSLPPGVTASTGMDALVQVLEPFVSVRANALTDLFCREGMTRAANSLLRAYADGADMRAREDMAFASLMGGLALANAGLGAVHGFAAPLGAMFTAPHGAVCAALLAVTTEVNLRALRKREPENAALPRYQEAAQILVGPSASRDDLPRRLAEMSAALAIPGLGAWGMRRADIPEAAERAAAASSMKANSIPLLREELVEILERCL
ncbi:MAG TPA: iron-containing alcohol dehydrogenase [Anaerolineaceae bacterium]